MFLSTSPVMEDLLPEKVAWAPILDRDITQLNITLNRSIDGIEREIEI